MSTMPNSMEYLLLLIVISFFHTTESLDCLACKNNRNISDCLTIVHCSQDEQCYTDVTGIGPNAIFNLGCRTNQECWATAANTTTPSPIASIVGRHVRDDSTSCKQCCSQDFCNRHLCSHAVSVITDQDGQCEDNSDYNCELISGAFNVCSNLHQAKTYCRKWCGLCHFTDGGWSVWTPWGSCDVTCSTGHRSRSRSCTNPKPSVGGLDCIGNSSEISQCTLDTCPVHGNWTLWSSWDTCSVTCGVGLERRDRSCTLPAPGPHGHPCVGDAHEDRVCMVKACSDGHWATWTSWGTCSATCNGGLKVKHRSCDSPAPSLLGKYCRGNNIEYATCNSQDCPHQTVFFTATNPDKTLIDGGRPFFNEVTANEGNGYNQTAAIFTCPTAGLYHFTFNFLGGSIVYTQCSLYHNQVQVAFSITKTTSGWHSASASIYVHMDKGDTFYALCSGWDNIYPGGRSEVFTGALIQSS